MKTQVLGGWNWAGTWVPCLAEFSGRLMQLVQGPDPVQEGLQPLSMHIVIMGFPWLSNVPCDSWWQRYFHAHFCVSRPTSQWVTESYDWRSRLDAARGRCEPWFGNGVPVSLNLDLNYILFWDTASSDVVLPQIFAPRSGLQSYHLKVIWGQCKMKTWSLKGPVILRP